MIVFVYRHFLTSWLFWIPIKGGKSCQNPVGWRGRGVLEWGWGATNTSHLAKGKSSSRLPWLGICYIARRRVYPIILDFILTTKKIPYTLRSLQIFPEKKKLKGAPCERRRWGRGAKIAGFRYTQSGGVPWIWSSEVFGFDPLMTSELARIVTSCLKARLARFQKYERLEHIIDENLMLNLSQQKVDTVVCCSQPLYCYLRDSF